jgi:serine/threonine protein kinase
MCTKHNCKNVIEILESDSLEFTQVAKYPRVEYVILEVAPNGDVMDLLDAKKVDLEWKMRSLHQLSKGLNELHQMEIVDQDIKPSNIVSMGNGKTKITDLGSAVTLNPGNRELPAHLEKNYAGSWEYAPPELLYGEIDGDPKIRRIGCDLYLLGSMITFYFTDMSITALIKYNLEDSFCWTDTKNIGNFGEVKSYLIKAFQQALNDIGKQIDDALVVCFIDYTIIKLKLLPLNRDIYSTDLKE